MWQRCMLSAVITLTSNGPRLYWLRIKELVKKSYLAVSGSFLRKSCHLEFHFVIIKQTILVCKVEHFHIFIKRMK
jgi:hypothetical protein